jgi:hypothetical protein
MGIAPDIVMKFTGHKHYSAMKPYIEISSKSKREAMDLFGRKSTVVKKTANKTKTNKK